MATARADGLLHVPAMPVMPVVVVTHSAGGTQRRGGHGSVTAAGRDSRRSGQGSSEQDSGQNGQSSQIDLRKHPASFYVVEQTPLVGRHSLMAN
jgi:hypothetical protein